MSTGRLACAVLVVLLLGSPATAKHHHSHYHHARCHASCASWYGGGERLASHTASGSRFRRDGNGCAHRTYRFGTILEVENLWNGRVARCVVNDRGPARSTRRVLDLCRGVARRLGMIHSGVVQVRIRVVR